LNWAKMNSFSTLVNFSSFAISFACSFGCQSSDSCVFRFVFLGGTTGGGVLSIISILPLLFSPLTGAVGGSGVSLATPLAISGVSFATPLDWSGVSSTTPLGPSSGVSQTTPLTRYRFPKCCVPNSRMSMWSSSINLVIVLMQLRRLTFNIGANALYVISTPPSSLER